jgi:streptogramin lyase
LPRIRPPQPLDGTNVWFAAGDRITAFDPQSGEAVRSIDVAAHADTTFDGTHLFQIAEAVIQKIDPRTGQVVATIPSPSGGASGMAWAESSLWVGEYRGKKIYQVDPATGTCSAASPRTASSPVSSGPRVPANC